MHTFREMLIPHKEAIAKVYAMDFWEETYFFCFLASAKPKSIIQNSAFWNTGFKGIPNNHITADMGPKEQNMTPLQWVQIVQHLSSTPHPLTSTLLCNKDVTHTSIHQGYKRFYPPATW